MNIASARTAMPPFDQARVDRLMEEAGIDVLFATSKHNTQYLLGGYKFIFFSAMDAIGHSRYLPIVIYEKGGPDHAAYIGNRMEGGEHQNNPFWTPTLHLSNWGTLDAASLGIEHLKAIGKADARIGIEPPFLPSDAYVMLRQSLPDAKLVGGRSELRGASRYLRQMAFDRDAVTLSTLLEPDTPFGESISQTDDKFLDQSRARTV